MDNFSKFPAITKLNTETKICLKMDVQKPKISCSQTDAMCDVPISICVEGLKPEGLYTLHSFSKPTADLSFECAVKYQADLNGKIDMETNPALGGNYSGVEPMGIFWSMKPSPTNKISHPRFIKKDVTTPLVLTLEVYDCDVDVVQLKNKQATENKVASTTIKRWYMAPGTKRILLTVKEHGFHGVLFIPPGEGPFPAVIHMFGMQPGSIDYKASLISSHGFVTLALAVFGVPGTPKLQLSPENDWTLKLEYFENAINFLLEVDKVEKSAGVGVIVQSFTGFIGLAMATFLPDVRCLIHENAAGRVVHADLTYKDLKFSGNDILLQNPSYTHDGAIIARNIVCPLYGAFSLTSPTPKDMCLKFYEQKHVAFLFIACLSDNNSPSEYYVNRAHRLLKLAKHPNYEILRYPGASHLLEPPFDPYNKNSFLKNYFAEKSIVSWGGNPLANIKAQQHAWKRRISFLKRNLGKRASL